jgi:hypothetical protein
MKHNMTPEEKQLIQEILRRLAELEKKSIKFNPDAQTLIELKEMVKKAGFTYP